jgi:hypothetical protein
MHVMTDEYERALASTNNGANRVAPLSGRVAVGLVDTTSS